MQAAFDGIVDSWRSAAVRAGNAACDARLVLQLSGSRSEHAAVRGRRQTQRPSGRAAPLIETRRVLRFPGAEVGDCFEPLVLLPNHAGVVERIAAALPELEGAWKLAFFEKVEGRVAAQIRTTLDEANLRTVTSGRSSLPTIDLGTRTWEEYLRERSRNFRSEIGRKRRALERDHNVQFIEVRQGDELATALAHTSLCMTSGARREGQAVRKLLWVRPFFAAFVYRAADQGWLRLWRLLVDGEPVASWCGWSIGGRYSYYQAGLDVTWSRFSPGTLLSPKPSAPRSTKAAPSMTSCSVTSPTNVALATTATR